MKELLKRPIAFHPVLARLFGGINEAILWQQIHYWSDKCLDLDGWVYKTKEDIEFETTLTRKQQDTARANLERGGFLKTELRKVNNAPTLHYQCQIGLVQKGLMEKPERGESIEKPERDFSSIQRVPETTTSADKPRDYRPYEEKPERQKKPSKYPHALEVFALFPKPDPSWRINTTELKHAELLFARGLDKVAKALAFYEEHKHLEFCHEIVTPFDLNTKWLKLQNFRDKRT